MLSITRTDTEDQDIFPKTRINALLGRAASYSQLPPQNTYHFRSIFVRYLYRKWCLGERMAQMETNTDCLRRAGTSRIFGDVGATSRPSQAHSQAGQLGPPQDGWNRAPRRLFGGEIWMRVCGHILTDGVAKCMAFLSLILFQKRCEMHAFFSCLVIVQDWKWGEFGVRRRSLNST